jgi:hypothetical protein
MRKDRQVAWHAYNNEALDFVTLVSLGARPTAQTRGSAVLKGYSVPLTPLARTHPAPPPGTQGVRALTVVLQPRLPAAEPGELFANPQA